ncbi:TPA: methylase [Candidatus Gastranaerophilales bacterium HUM_19]|nr:MAG TPA: methylase [Candidatus Gastranaerophilales bacterium HUM_17]DAB18055.1 MAG TPA: methylase [Candidatus Gastranaerophilales bacterium HUM_19]DAB26971.1 MAG TPA: methylase [Candidatus Gastranaerophilales bacterium HUM_23]
MTTFLFEEIKTIREYAPKAYKELPKYVVHNLTQKYQIRPYQEQAFRNFITYFENDRLRHRPSQVLFHMATGSGKTLIMAGLILYLYKKGYRIFLFFVNADNIVQKTKDNFINRTSSKYLFNDEINIDGQSVKIRTVENFQDWNKDDINICFTTIQGLHMSLNQFKENGLTDDDFAEKKIVLIADEAHHLNIETKKGLSPSEKEYRNNWETTVNRIFNSDVDNILLEFTATCDLENPYILSEYEKKIIVDYPLRKFREDGYSKEVKTLQSHVSLIDRVLQAVLLSQYRLKLFQDNKKLIKPVILFKSDKIDSSKKFYQEEFRPLIDNLSESDLLRIRTQTSNPLLVKMYEYFDTHTTNEQLISEIKEDFSHEKCISVNSKEDKGTYQLLINSLEDRNNLIRCIFAVDQLNEGWDVLNLFDIVRLYETRSAERHGGPGRQTIQEAQLIGRGARYCPFTTSDKSERFLRKFDDDIDNELRVCETLYYHCMYNSLFISELTTAMKGIGLLPDNIKECSYILKEDFKRDIIYNNGLVFENERVVKSRKQITELLPSVRTRDYEIDLSSGATSIVNLLAPSSDVVKTLERVSTKSFTIGQIAEKNYSIVHKALRQFNIFKFNILQQYYPNLKSTKQFITDNNYLGNIKINIKISNDEITNEQLYIACKLVVEKISNSISDIEETFEGTKEFKSRKICEVFRDKTVSYTDPHGDGQGVSQSHGAISEHLKVNLPDEDWFVFTDNFGTSEEKEFVAYFKEHVQDLKNKYEKVYLIRNERQLKLFSFNGGERFEPDYVLIMTKQNGNITDQYQIFIEPKGSHLIQKDSWKESFLLEIESSGIPVKTLVNDNNYKITGFPFFNRAERQSQFNEAMTNLLVAE